MIINGISISKVKQVDYVNKYLNAIYGNEIVELKNKGIDLYAGIQNENIILAIGLETYGIDSNEIVDMINQVEGIAYNDYLECLDIDLFLIRKLEYSEIVKIDRNKEINGLRKEFRKLYSF